MKFIIKKIYIIFFLLIALLSTSKTFARDNNIKYAGENISNYFLGVISANQGHSKEAFKYLKIICNLIQKNDGGMLIIDYGYADSKMHETLQAVNNHKYSNILENIGDSDITYNINFHSFE